MESRVPTSGLGPTPAEQPVSPASRCRIKHKYPETYLGQGRGAQPEPKQRPRINVQNPVGMFRLRPAPTGVLRAVTVLSFPIPPAYSTVTNFTTAAKRNYPANIKFVDWSKWTCSIHLVWTPTRAPFAHGARAPFRLKPGHLVGSAL